MPQSLRSKLNKLVYKGLLKEEDLKRIIITNPMSKKEESSLLSNVYNEGFDKGYEKAKAEYAPKWTRVEDGLPETHEDKHYCPKVSDNVVCKVKDGDDIIDTVGFLKEFNDGEKKWNTVYEVIAWMPIPKYEGVSE